MKKRLSVSQCLPQDHERAMLVGRVFVAALEGPVLVRVQMLSGILDEFYSCPACGQTAVLNEEMYAQQAMKAYAWQQAVAMELF